MIKSRYLPIKSVVIFLTFSMHGGLAFAEKYVAGNHGNIHVYGSLIENACQLEMESEDQSVNLGNITTSSLKRLGDKGIPVPFQIKLVDCSPAYTHLLYDKTNTNTWSSYQPGVKIQFIAQNVESFPELASVNGAKGIGLEISNKSGEPIALGQQSRPTLLYSPQDTLQYYVTPVNVGQLEPNAFQAIISFELIYE